MEIHLVDGTYELFRAYYAMPSAKASDGSEVGATRGLANSLLALIRNEGATHLAVAFDHTVESFRNKLFAGYKTGDGVPAELLTQFETAEQVTHALGIVVWPMTEFEADDALCSGARRYAASGQVSRVLLCTPDKDLAQCVRGDRIVCLDRRRKKILDEAGVIEKFGVAPASIPDWLALVGDSADGIPGIPRWGARSASTVLAAYGHVDDIPDDPAAWQFKVRGAVALADNLARRREEVRLYRKLATLRDDVPLAESVADLEWLGARRAELHRLSELLGMSRLIERVPRWRD